MAPMVGIGTTVEMTAAGGSGVCVAAGDGGTGVRVAVGGSGVGVPVTSAAVAGATTGSAVGLGSAVAGDIVCDTTSMMAPMPNRASSPPIRREREGEGRADVCSSDQIGRAHV